MARRAKGEGSIGPYKGKWRVRISVHGRRKAWVFATKQEAARKLRTVIKEIEQGRTVDDMRTLGQRRQVGEYLAEWLAGVAVRMPHSYADYENALRPIVRGFGSMQLAELTPRLLTQHFAEAWTRRSWKRWLVLRCALGDAVTLGLIARNPLEGVRVPRRAESIGMSLTADEVAAVLQECQADHDVGPLVAMALVTGMRLGELRALTWRDVDFATGAVSVTKCVTWVHAPIGGGWEVGPPKTRNSRRIVEVGPQLLALLERHRLRLRTEQLKASRPWAHPELVFPGPRGGYYSDPRPKLDALLTRARAQRIRFHDLRHTAATMMLLRGVPIHVVSKILGHGNIAITLGLYAHVLDPMRHTATRVMDSLLENPTQNHYRGDTFRDRLTSRETPGDGNDSQNTLEGMAGW